MAFQRSSIPQEFRVPTYLFIDEFQNFISDDIEKALTQLRKYALHLVLANQYVGQVASPALQKALFSAGVLIAGKNERNSLRAISRELDVPIHVMMNLSLGEFLVKSHHRKPLLVKAPKLLLNGNYSVSNKEWQRIRGRNLRQYYCKLNHWVSGDYKSGVSR